MSFRFKQFSIEDDRSSMKVGTDAVLLGTRAEHPAPASILDIGTGSGLIALMMAQRYPDARILGIDIHPASVMQAEHNFDRSPWGRRLSAKETSLQEYARAHAGTHDLIVSNPPFFHNALLPPDPGKASARHTRDLSYADMAGCTRILLAPEGLAFLILPAMDHLDFEAEARRSGLHEISRLIITPVSGKKPNRIISGWSSAPGAINTHHLTIRKDPITYTQEYKRLTQNFYLAL